MVFVRGPIWSSDEPIAIRPERDTAPYVGLRPIRPVCAAGCLIEPPVSEPSAATAIPPATAAADPPDEPPGIRGVSRGFFVGPKAEFSVELPIANSSIFVLPRKTAYWFFSFSITVASYDAT